MAILPLTYHETLSGEKMKFLLTASRSNYCTNYRTNKSLRKNGISAGSNVVSEIPHTLHYISQP